MTWVVAALGRTSIRSRPGDAAPSPDADLRDAAPDPTDATPPVDAVVEPPPGPVNRHTDRYDPGVDRVLISHCGRDALLAIDLAGGGHAVIRIDLVSGAQTLRHDGTANAQGDRITCSPQTAFDSTRDRLLLLVSPCFRCTEGLYAVDTGDGTLARLPFTLVPAATRAPLRQ